MENNDLEKNQSSLDFENEELSIFNQEKPVSKIISDFKPAEIKENVAALRDKEKNRSNEKIAHMRERTAARKANGKAKDK